MYSKFSHISKLDYLKLFPAHNNRVLYLKNLIFNYGVEHVVSIMLAIICRIHLKNRTIVKPLRELFLGNYSETFFNGKTAIIMNESIVLPKECEIVSFNFISPVPFDLNLEYDVK